ncbi:hypothetical protein [Longispora urticae]
MLRSQPAPIGEPCADVAFVIPSIAADEYDKLNAGCGPAGACGVFNGYDHEKPPPESPAVHDDDSPNDDFEKSPAGPPGADANAYTGAETPTLAGTAIERARGSAVSTGAASTSADTVLDTALLVAPNTGVCVWHSLRSGVTSTHAGNSTRTSREP